MSVKVKHGVTYSNKKESTVSVPLSRIDSKILKKAIDSFNGKDPVIIEDVYNSIKGYYKFSKEILLEMKPVAEAPTTKSYLSEYPSLGASTHEAKKSNENHTTTRSYRDEYPSLGAPTHDANKPNENHTTPRSYTGIGLTLLVGAKTFGPGSKKTPIVVNPWHRK